MKIEVLSIFLVLAIAVNSAIAQEPSSILRAPPIGEDSIVAQRQEDTEQLSNVPDDLRTIREQQLLAARDEGVELNFRDSGDISQTTIRGVPLGLRNLRITNEDQMAALGETLAPLFGFSGSEALVFRFKSGGAYVFEQKINGLPVDGSVITVGVGPTGEIVAIRGTAIIERNFGVRHALEEQSAIEAVRQFIKAQDGDVAWEATLVYKSWDDNRILAPWWLVSAPRYAEYYVDPNGAVSNSIQVTP